MFDSLAEKLQATLADVRGHGTLTEADINAAMREVRLALLEADVNYKVVKDFAAAVKESALGAEVLASLSPDQHFIKIVHEEMTRMMGAQAQELNLARKPPVPVVMLVGLQGSGKTTTCGKLALYLPEAEASSSVALVPADVYRPAAIEQLKVLGRQLEIPVFDSERAPTPIRCGICREALTIPGTERLRHGPPRHRGAPSHRRAADGGTLPDQGGGRPGDILLVADAMTGQDAVNVAEAFDKVVASTAWS